MTSDEVDQVAQGRVWTGEQALRHGLVDEIGGVARALEILKEKAGIPRGDGVELVEYPRRKSFLDLLVTRLQLGGETNLPAGVSQWVLQWKLLEKLSANPWWVRMPFEVNIR